MVVEYSETFKKSSKKIKNKETRRRVGKLLDKLIENPLTGKPMRYSRKGLRELYFGSFRLSYSYNGKIISFLNIYHKDEQH